MLLVSFQKSSSQYIFLEASRHIILYRIARHFQFGRIRSGDTYLYNYSYILFLTRYLFCFIRVSLAMVHEKKIDDRKKMSYGIVNFIPFRQYLYNMRFLLFLLFFSIETIYYDKSSIDYCRTGRFQRQSQHVVF